MSICILIHAVTERIVMNEVSPRLDELFRASKGQPVEFERKLVWLSYVIPIGKQSATGTLSIGSFKSEPVQGICLQMNKGELEVAGVRNSSMVLWTDTAPQVVEFAATGQEESALQIWNCWQGRFGEREAWIGSAGLICEKETDFSYHFFCSDGPDGAEFSAIEFDLMIEDQGGYI